RLAWRDSWDSGPAMGQLRQGGRELVEGGGFSALWRTEPFGRDGAGGGVLALCQGVGLETGQGRRARANLVVALRPLAQFLTWLARGDAARRRDYDTLESLLLKLQRDLKKDTRKGSGFFADGVRREDVLAGRDRLLAALDDFRIRANAHLA